MPISHAERKEMKTRVYNNVVNHILTIRKIVKVNDMFEQFRGDVFTNAPYFVRSFVIHAENDSRIHIKSAQRAGTLAAPIDIPFPELKKKSVNNKKQKKLTADTVHVKDEKPKEKVSEVEKPEVKKEKPVVDMSTDHEKNVPKPSKTELFGDKKPDEASDWEEDRFFTDNDDREYEGKLTDIEPDDNWYPINKRLLTQSGYTDVIELYSFDDDHTHEYLAITSEGKTFHFVKAD